MKRGLIVIVLLLGFSPVSAQEKRPFRSLMRAMGALSLPLPQKVETEPETYEALEARMFQRMNWGAEEIDWFRNVYTPLYGNPEQYIRDIAAGYEALDSDHP